MPPRFAKLMKIVRRLLLGLLIGLALVRAAGYLAYAALLLPSPLETYHLEAKMVLLAYRAEVGLPAYPEWHDYPYVTNFYGPVYFGLVGRIGRIGGADIPGLFRIGRLVSFASGIATSLLVGVIAARRYGRAAGFAGAILGLATSSMNGFSVMTRPDLPAEFVGVLGFFLAIDRRAPIRLAGIAVLVLAILTKQTAAIFLIAASLGWLLQGDWRRWLEVGLGGTIAFGLVVGATTLLVEPGFAGSLTGESKAPWVYGSWLMTFARIAQPSPDVLYFPALGILLWTTTATGRRDLPMATLAALLLVMGLVASAKYGSDVNYYLSLRVVETLAVGALWRAWQVAATGARSAALLAAALVGCLTAVPGAVLNVMMAQAEAQSARFLDSSAGRSMVAFKKEICARAADPNFHLLTDSPLFELYQRERAPFGDPFLFRGMVNTGRLDPSTMRDRIDAAYYDLVVTTSDLQTPAYATYEFGLPMTLVEHVRTHYAPIGTRAGLFLYRRRSEVDPARRDPAP